MGIKKRFCFFIILMTGIFTSSLWGQTNTNDITSFSIGTAKGTISGTNIFIAVPEGTNIKSLTPTITITGVSMSPASGVAQDFTKQVPFPYIVTASDGSKKTYTVSVAVSFSADNVSFNMVYVPGGLTFPIGPYDNVIAKIDRAYWIGETELTYELWYTVKTWAEPTTTDKTCYESGQGCYTFANKGLEGAFRTIGAAPTATGKNEPVTTINWRDNMIFTNALTEWYNAKNNTKYTCAYYTDSAFTKPIRAVDNNKISADLTNGITALTPNGNQDAPYVKANATGFRMLTSSEEEFVARYIGTTKPTEGTLKNDVKTTVNNGVTYYWTPGNYASGATDYAFKYAQVFGGKMDNLNDGATRAVAWYYGYGGTQAVKKLKPNQLGIYNMNGNVQEWCSDWMLIGGYRFLYGGSWFFNETDLITTGASHFNSPYSKDNSTGIRLGRTAD